MTDYGVDEKFEVTIWNDKGEIVVHEYVDGLTATDAEIEEMVFPDRGWVRRAHCLVPSEATWRRYHRRPADVWRRETETTCRRVITSARAAR